MACFLAITSHKNLIFKDQSEWINKQITKYDDTIILKVILMFTIPFRSFFITLTLSGFLSLLSAQVILDPDASDWTVTTFAGNRGTGDDFYPGPAQEVGGIFPIETVVELPDSAIWMNTNVGIIEVDKNGTLRKVMGTDGYIEGPIEQCVSGTLYWNPSEERLYMSGPNCLRRIMVDSKGKRRIEVTAGTPGKNGSVDGPSKSALFPNVCKGVVCTKLGAIYWLEASGKLRKIQNDSVSTLLLNFLDPPAAFNFTAVGGMCNSTDPESLYISDYYNFRIMKCDVASGNLNCICKASGESNTDGNAFGAGFNSGLMGYYDSFHDAIWVGGPDENRLRWLKDGLVRTVVGTQYNFMWTGIRGFDKKGGVYFHAYSHPYALFRAYNIKEVQP